MSDERSRRILTRLHDLHPKAIDLSLERIERLLAKLGHPERDLPPVVHIAGTNGKGSTLAMLDAMLAANGWSVHRYVSPHLVRFNERILLNGAPIEDEDLEDTLSECERVNGGEPITFFEITTAAAFLAFARTAADWLLLETGLGGRLDATNVVANPRLVLISPISMDHEAYLGDTLAKIAHEKAGIIKPEAPLILGPQRPEALEVLLAKAAACEVPAQVYGRDWRAWAEMSGLRLVLDDEEHALPLPVLQGTWQVENAGLAAVAGLELGLDLEVIAKGLRTARWPARLQRLHKGPLCDLLGEGTELWLDGGHNPAAALGLARSLPDLAKGRPVHLVVGMLDTKDTGGFLAPLAPLVAGMTAVTVPNEAHARLAASIAGTGASLGLPARTAPSVEAALQACAASAGDTPTLILICGSLYLAGHVLADNS